MKTTRTVEWVVMARLCVGCGTCEAVCNRDAVRMVIDQGEGVYVPTLDRDKCNECGLCLAVCPGYAVDFAKLSHDVYGKDVQGTPLGNYLNCYIGHAADHGVRYGSASGGLVTALLIHALEEGQIDGAVVTKMREDRPLEPQPFIARTKEELVAASRSKYCPVPVNIVLKEILEAGESQRFAVVGLPCHIQGIRKAEALIRKLRGRITLQFGLVCSHSDSFHETEFLLREHGFKKEDVARIDYRGPGWPGYLTVRTRSGIQKAIPFDEYISAHSGYFFTPWRCTLCCDMGARLADISFMDAWLPEVRARDNLGTSIIVCRTERGQASCMGAATRGRVDVRELSAADALRSQGGARMSNLDFGAHVRFAGMSRRSTPHYVIELPRSRPHNYLRALVMHLNMWVSSKRTLHGLIRPLIRVESRLTMRPKARV